MQLLDASLAFVLTLAALATVVTTIMEACVRILKMRKNNLITVMKLLNDEIGKGPLKMSPQERWRFFSKVVANPATEKNLAKEKKLAQRLSWTENDVENEATLSTFLKSFGKIKDRKKVFNKVTLEYLLRCFSESDTVQKAALETKEMLQTELNRIARKYEEFGSAVSANFKQHAQTWSIVIGILLAIAANVDGVRIFEAYRADPKLTAAVIAQHENLIEKNEEVQAKLDRLNNDGNEIKTTSQDESEFTAPQETMQNAQDQIADLVALGIPIGWKFYPNCPFGKDKEEEQWEKACKACKDLPKKIREKPFDSILCGFITPDDALFGLMTTIKNDFTGFLVWLFKVIITGVLIGLGAPFWFDVAKRLSMIRKGLNNPNSTAEDRLAARDANGNAEERKKIVEDVLSDTCRESSVSRNMSKTTGPKRIVL